MLLKFLLRLSGLLLISIKYIKLNINLPMVIWFLTNFLLEIYRRNISIALFQQFHFHWIQRNWLSLFFIPSSFNIQGYPTQIPIKLTYCWRVDVIECRLRTQWTWLLWFVDCCRAAKETEKTRKSIWTLTHYSLIIL